jgi:DNA polymerase-3 subunit delta
VKLTYAQYPKSKDAPCLGAWCLLFGPEDHLKREALARIRARVEAAFGEEPTWEVVDGSTLTARELLNRCQTGALFGGARVVVVRGAQGIDGDEQEKLAKAVAELPPGVAVILVASGGGGRGARRGVLAKLANAIEEQGLAIDFPALKAPEAARWAIAKAKQLGKKLEPAAAHKLADQKVGTGLADLEAEVEKLALFVGDSPTIGGAHVEEVTPRRLEDDIFRLVDAVGRRQAGRAVAILRELLRDRREEPGNIVGMLAQAIRLIWQTKLLVERGWKPNREPDAETAAMLPQDDRKNALAQFQRKQWLVSRTITQANAFSWGQLKRAIHALHGCDLAIKSIQGKVTDPEVAVELLVVQLCTDLEMPLWEGPKAWVS